MRITLVFILLLSSGILLAGRKSGYAKVKEQKIIDQRLYSTFSQTDQRFSTYAHKSSSGKEPTQQKYYTNAPHKSYGNQQGCSVQ